MPQRLIANEWEAASRRSITILWEHDTINTWNYANRFGMNQSVQHINSSMNHFVRSLFIGTRDSTRCLITQRSITAQQSLFLLTVSDFTQYSQDFADQLQNIFSAERNMWLDSSTSNYVVALIPSNINTEEIAGFARSCLQTEKQLYLH
jgi:hypothetical protein